MEGLALTKVCYIKFPTTSLRWQHVAGHLLIGFFGSYICILVHGI